MRNYSRAECATCHKMFWPKGTARPAYCSVDCRNPRVACPTCGKVFRPRQRGYQTFCSQRCHYASRPAKPEITANGYVLIYVPRDTPGARVDRRMLEHRYVMQQSLGRPLRKNETIHHRNGDKTDNRLENLELRIGNHGKGASEAHCPTCTCFKGPTSLRWLSPGS